MQGIVSSCCCWYQFSIVYIYLPSLPSGLWIIRVWSFTISNTLYSAINLDSNIFLKWFLTAIVWPILKSCALKSLFFSTLFLIVYFLVELWHDITTTYVFLQRELVPNHCLNTRYHFFQVILCDLPVGLYHGWGKMDSPGYQLWGWCWNSSKQMVASYPTLYLSYIET